MSQDPNPICPVCDLRIKSRNHFRTAAFREVDGRRIDFHSDVEATKRAYGFDLTNYSAARPDALRALAAKFGGVK